MKISDYLESNVLSVLDRDIQYLENKIKVFDVPDSEAEVEELFATRAKDKELLAESLALRDKLVNLIDFTGTWMAEEEK